MMYMHTPKQDNYLNASVCFSSLSDILRSIDTFTMLCSFLKNPFVVTAYYKSNATKIQAKSIRLDYNLKQNFDNTKQKGEKMTEALYDLIYIMSEMTDIIFKVIVAVVSIIFIRRSK